MNSTVTAVESVRFLGTTISQDLKWDNHIESVVKKSQQRLYFFCQLRKFNLPQELLIQFYSAIIDCWANHWYNPPHSPGTVLIRSEQKGCQNHSGPLTFSTLPLWPVTVWSTLQSSEHQNDQTQEQFLPSGNPSHEHLTLNVEHTTLLYIIYSPHILFFLQVCSSDLFTQLSVLYIVFLLFCTLPICILFFCCLCHVLFLSFCCTVELL